MDGNGGPGALQAEGRVLRQKAELVADDAAGQRRQQIVDELRVRLGGVAHAPTPRENGTTRFNGSAWPVTRTCISIRTDVARRLVLGPHVGAQHALDARLVPQRLQDVQLDQVAGARRRSARRSARDAASRTSGCPSDASSPCRVFNRLAIAWVRLSSPCGHGEVALGAAPHRRQVGVLEEPASERVVQPQVPALKRRDSVRRPASPSRCSLIVHERRGRRPEDRAARRDPRESCRPSAPGRCR